MDTADEDFYPCVGICTADPDSGYCLGCGRPPPPVIVEVVAKGAPPAEPPSDQPE